ncbi:pH response protein PalF [Cordyceps fumosorosea ARSEF 2679]|uniref:pH response protein PalF n=1 Tax=Cordyceps fumosorosea (strain ARSEF 2679) TaxID=1081104 RepID=A0A168E8M9_CORFA|nr:pH response protein PalF [Cordyceps fumosorosea ARSEF 2679]OAA73506.1 pH response protein PalF [Cordyceps fumosorosea ARSEF 2679]
MPLAAAGSHHGGGNSSSSSSNPNPGAPSDDDPKPAAVTTAVPSTGPPASPRVAAAAAASAADHRTADTGATAAVAAPAGAMSSTAVPRLNTTLDNAASSASSSSAKPATPPSVHSATSNTSTSRTAALLSRLNLPSFNIRSRNRNVLDFHIRPDEPHRTYNAGDTVRGHVNVAVLKAIRITHLVVALHGYVHVFKDASAKAKASGSPVAPRGGISELPQYHGNGLASLFQDEQVLAGEGRLEAGRYEFGFQLIFPDIGLPSSIDFERGTISYMITATLTRPTAIAPTMSCEKRVLLVEKIDIGHLPPPRSRTIFLEPISKRTRRKRSVILDKPPAPIPEPPPTGVPNDHTSEAGSVERTGAASDSARDSTQPENNRGPTQIDVRSEISGESGRSISTAVSRSDVTPLSHASTFKSPSKQKLVDNKTITATIELLKGGCLAGDMVTVRVSVQHIKRLKCLTGVIVTLFRQSKIDSAPAASLFSGNDFEAIGDDGYPRSRTGLAGLSLSSTGSTSMFRKDLDQNTAPLIIDPLSLHASVTCSLKLPDDAFPTIRGVPGAMVSFRYHIEVIVDLGGKLSSQMLQGAQSTTRLGQYMTSGVDNAYGPRVATNIIDTSPLRRQKGVVSVSMETVVGTVDSSRRRKLLRISPRLPTPRVTESDEDDIIRAELSERSSAASPVIYTTAPSERNYASQPPLLHPSRANASPAAASQPDFHSHSHVNGHSREAAPAYIPQPHMPDSRNMSEKERIRQAETRLLPSQPSAAGPSSSPSAPDEDNIYDAHDQAPLAGPSAPTDHEAVAGPSAPSEDDLHGSSAFPAEDKQELERRRLINEASAPPEFPDDMERSDGPSPANDADAEPSAPVFDEDEEELAGYGVSAGPSSSAGPSRSNQRSTGEQLPAYQR